MSTALLLGLERLGVTFVRISTSVNGKFFPPNVWPAPVYCITGWRTMMK